MYCVFASVLSAVVVRSIKRLAFILAVADVSAALMSSLKRGNPEMVTFLEAMPEK